MSNEDYLKDISEIKNLMSKSSRFISLSGLSGILAGIYALIGAFLAYRIINEIKLEKHTLNRFFLAYDSVSSLIVIAIAVIFLSVITGVILTQRKAKKHNEKIFETSSKRLLINFLIPLITGGILCIILINKQYFDLIASTTLIFYGLSCVNASKYTLGDIRYLGFANITLGLVATQFVGYGLYFWAVGFGIMHIIYGTMMHFKYDVAEKK
ncbi:MAG: hypothetical protein WA775_04015 [Psychroserpens sp.]|uniref:hypothetical protein n=1 Tax=Psychroserpens sp. TaxID=2020870 RepID=UPI003CA07122